MSDATAHDDPPPRPPVMPDLDDCCGQGCDPCVFDLYDARRERYLAALKAWQARQEHAAALPAADEKTARDTAGPSPAPPA